MTVPEPADPNREAADAGVPPGAPTPDELRKALQAFKKRIKLMRLDDESRLGHGAMTSGGRSDIVAVAPPTQFPRAVWDELVRQGRLKYSGQGLYALVKP